MLLQDRDEEARSEIEAAWERRDDGPVYTFQRILFLRVLIARLRGEPAQDHVRALRVELGRTREAMEWNVVGLLDHIRPRLADADNELLMTLASAINDPGERDRLSHDIGEGT
jgi:hypothetical protein